MSLRRRAEAPPATHPARAADTPVTGRALAVDLLWVLGVSVAAAVVAGFAWAALVPSVEVLRTADGFTTSEVALGRRFGNDGWFATLSAGVGLLSGLALTVWRRTHESFTVLVVVVGALLGSWLMAQVGGWAGPPDPFAVLAEAPAGTAAPEQVRVTAAASYLVWPVAALVGALIALWTPSHHGEPVHDKS